MTTTLMLIMMLRIIFFCVELSDKLQRAKKKFIISLVSSFHKYKIQQKKRKNVSLCFFEGKIIIFTFLTPSQVLMAKEFHRIIIMQLHNFYLSSSKKFISYSGKLSRAVDEWKTFFFFSLWRFSIRIYNYFLIIIALVIYSRGIGRDTSTQ